MSTIPSTKTIMYPGQKDSPTTFLMGDISNLDTYLTVASAAVLPQGPFPYPLTIGVDAAVTEVVLVTAINGNQLTITRNDPSWPSPAMNWPAGTAVARTLTAHDFDTLQENIDTLFEHADDARDDITAAEGVLAVLQSTPVFTGVSGKFFEFDYL